MGHKAKPWKSNVHAKAMRWKSIVEPQAMHCTSNVGPKAMHGKSKASPKDMQPKSSCECAGRSEGGGERERDGRHQINAKVGEEEQVKDHV